MDTPSILKGFKRLNRFDFQLFRRYGTMLEHSHKNNHSMDRIIEKKRWTTKKVVTLVGSGLFLILILYLFFFRDQSSRLYVNYDQLTVAEVKKDRFQEFIPVDGVVLPRSTIYIDAVQGGIVEQIFVEDGAQLNPGDTILKIQNYTMELNYMDQETRMYDAINNLQNTKIALKQNMYLRQKEIVDIEYQIDQTSRNFERIAKLYQDSLIALKEFEDGQRDYAFTSRQLNISLNLQRLDSMSGAKQTRQIDKSLERMENNLALLKRNLDNLFIKSPAIGRLSSFGAEIGETKQAGEHLGQIDMANGFKLRANIDERYISRVYIGQEAEFDFAGSRYMLEIGKIFSDVTNGSFQVDMIFNGEEPRQIKRGQTLQLRLKFSSPSDAIIVRRGGFFQETGGNWIYVIDNSGTCATRRNIRIGRQNTTYYEVMDGLTQGEKVIISSYDAFGGKDKLIFN